MLKVTGMQWKWQYEYPDSGVKFISTLSTPRDQIGNSEQKANIICSRSIIRWSCRWARSACPADLNRRDPHLVGAAVRGQTRRHPGVPPAKPGSRSRSPAFTAASAPNCAARTTASCRWSSTPCRKREYLAWSTRRRPDRRSRRWRRPHLEQGRVNRRAKAKSMRSSAPSATKPTAGRSMRSRPLRQQACNSEWLSKDGKLIPDSHVDRVMNGKPNTAMQAFKNTCPTPKSLPSSPSAEQVRQHHGRHDPTRPDRGPALGRRTMSIATTHPRTPRRIPPQRHPALADDDESWDIGTMYLTFAPHHVLRRRHHDPGGPGQLFQPGLQMMKPEFSTSSSGACPGDDLRGAHAGGDGLRELADPAHDRRPDMARCPA